MAPNKEKKRFHRVSYRDRVLVAVLRFGGKAFGQSSIVQQARLHSKRAGEKLISQKRSQKRADAGLANEVRNLMVEGLLGWNDDTQEVIVPARMRELLGDAIDDRAYDNSREAYIALSAKVRELLPPPKPKTRIQLIGDFLSLRWRFETAQQENEQIRAAQDARIEELRAVVKALLSRSSLPSPASTTVATVLNTPATPSTSRCSDVKVGASPLRRAFTTPAVLKCEDFDMPVTPAIMRAPFLQQGLPPLTPVSNPRPTRAMDPIREEPESPTRMRQSVAHNLFDEDEDMMDEDEDVQQPPSLLDKGKDALRRLAGAVGGPMHLLGGRASPVQAPPTPDMTPVFAKIASRGGAQREWSPRPLEMDFEEETVEDARGVQIRSLRDEVAQLKERLRAAQRAATDKDASLAELRGKLAEKEAALAGLVKGFLPMLPALAEAAKHVPGAGELVAHV